MAISAAKLMVIIGADISKLTSGLEKSDSMLVKFGTGAMKAGGVLTAGLTAPILAAGKSIFDIGAKLEQSTVAFTTMLGSGEKAGAFLRELQDFSASTPFEFVELQDTAKRMMAFGFESSKVLPMMTDIGDAAAGLGLGAEGVNRITLALGQMQAKGKVSAQEMMQLTEAGIPAWGYLADSMGLTTAEVMKLSEQGLIPAGLAIDAILAGLKEDFGGLMAAQAKTASGQISNLKDEMYGLAADLSQFVLPAAKEFVGTARDMIGAINALPAGTKEAAVGFLGWAAVVGPVTGAIGSLVKVGPSVLTFLAEFGASMQLIKGAGLAQTFSAASLGAGGLAAAMLPVLMTVGSLVGVWAAWNKNIVETNKEGQKAVEGAWKNFFQKQIEDGKSATQILKEYQAAQEGVKKSLEVDWSRVSPMAVLRGDWENFVKIFVQNKDQLVGDSDELAVAIGRTASSYTEYVNVMREAGLETDNQAGFGALMAGGYAQMAEMARNAAAGLTELGAMSGPAMDELAASGERGLSALQRMANAQSELRGQMDAWTNQAAAQAVQGLSNMNVESEKYLNGLQAVDEVMGTNYLQQQTLTNGLNELGNQYRRTGDMDAYKAGLEKLKSEGLETFQKGLENVTLKAQELYNKLLALPKEIQIRVGFMVGDFPQFSGDGGIGAAEIAANYDINRNGIIGQATGGDWLVTKPTLFLAGEAGPERATFTPMKNGAMELTHKSQQGAGSPTFNFYPKEVLDLEETAWKIFNYLQGMA